MKQIIVEEWIGYLTRILTGYAIHKRDGDCDEYILHQTPIIIVLLNFGGKLGLCCKSSETKVI